MNKTILLGRLVKDPEIRTIEVNDTKVAKFILAVNRKYVKQGEERQTDFIQIVSYSKLAEFCEKYLTKGQQICLCGRLEVRNYDDKEGQKRYVTEVIAEEINFADSQKNKETSDSDTTQNEENNIEETFDNADDLPF